MATVKQKLAVAGILTTIGVGGVVGSGLVSAQSNQGSGKSSDSLVQKIATKFNLNKDDVQSVFDADKSEHDAEMDQKMSEKLDSLVSEGKITSEQKDKIIAKRDELKAQREANRAAMKDKTAEERKAAMDTERSDLKKWAADNDIGEEYIRYVLGGPGGHEGSRFDGFDLK